MKTEGEISQRKRAERPISLKSYLCVSEVQGDWIELFCFLMKMEGQYTIYAEESFVEASF